MHNDQIELLIISSYQILIILAMDEKYRFKIAETPLKLC